MAPLSLASDDGFEQERWRVALVWRHEPAVGEHGGELVAEEPNADGNHEGRSRVVGAEARDEGGEVVAVDRRHGESVSVTLKAVWRQDAR